MTDKYPDIVTLIPTILHPSTKTFIMEGEIVAISETGTIKPFQTLAGRAKKAVPLAAVKVQVCIYAFDLMFLNGESLLGRPLRERRALLRGAFREVAGRFGFVKSIDATSRDEDELAGFFRGALESKCEGIMVKVLDEMTAEEIEASERAKAEGKASRRKALPATYGTSPSFWVSDVGEPDKRTLGWCKVKKDYVDGSDSMDLVPIGAWHGNGRKAGWWSPILLACRNEEDGVLQAVCKCISGFTDAFYKDLNVRYAVDGENTTYEKPWEYESALTPESAPPCQSWAKDSMVRSPGSMGSTFRGHHAESRLYRRNGSRVGGEGVEYAVSAVY
jgi:DNA ligase 1